MKRLLLLVVVAATFVSCIKHHSETHLKVHDPDDISGIYSVNYSIAVDDGVYDDFAYNGYRFQASGWPQAYVELSDNCDRYRFRFNSRYNWIKFDYLNHKEDLEVEREFSLGKGSSEGDYTFTATLRRAFSISTRFPGLLSYADIILAGNIKRRSEKRDWVHHPAGIAPVEETADMYYDLDMTIEMTPAEGYEKDFHRIRLEAASY